MRKLVLALTVLFGLTGCATTVQPGAPAPAPVPTGTGVGGCPRVLNLSEVDSGTSRCVAVGGSVVVTLTGRPGQDWAPPELSVPGVLKSEPVSASGSAQTIRRYTAVGPGTADITTSRSACPPPAPGAVACHAMQGWRVTVTVR